MEKKLNEIEDLRRKIEGFKSLLEEIRRFTGIGKIEQICKTFNRVSHTDFIIFEARRPVAC